MGRLLPGSWRGRIALVVALLVVGGVAYGANHYFNEVPDQLADDYREEAELAADRMTDAMDRVYGGFDQYLSASVRPRSYFRNADDLDELRRRVQPVLADIDDALDAGGKAVKGARERIKDVKPALHDRPSSWMLDDSEPLKEIDAAIKRSDAYARDARRYVNSLDRFIRYERERNDIIRRSWGERQVDRLGSDPSLEALRSAFANERQVNSELRSDLLKLKPHPDAKDDHAASIEEFNVVIDYYQSLQDAIDALSIAAYDQASDEFVAELKRLRERTRTSFAEFAARSSLQTESRKLGKRADALEEQIASLGTGDGEPQRGDNIRDPAPPAPKPKGGGKDEDKQLS